MTLSLLAAQIAEATSAPEGAARWVWLAVALPLGLFCSTGLVLAEFEEGAAPPAVSKEIQDAIDALKDSKPESDKAEVAATHKQARSINPMHDGQKIHLHTYCLDDTGDIWACDFLPELPAREDECQRTGFATHGEPLLLHVAREEFLRSERTVAGNDDWVAVVPYWAQWPFEVLLMPRFAVQRLPDLQASQRASLADVVGQITTRYDNLFQCDFPYSMGWHGAPTGASLGDVAHWQLHAHFYPPLLRSAEIRKFMVGFEMLAEAQRDLTPEQAAVRLREQPLRHFRERPVP